MPGIPTKFVVADKVFNTIRIQGGADADLLNDPNTLAFAYLGVIGVGIGDFLAARPDVGAAAPNTPYFQTWLPVLTMFSGSPAIGSTPATRGVYADVKQLRDTLLKLQDIVTKAVNGGPIEKDAQKLSLLGIKSDLDDLPNAINDLQAVVGLLNTLRTGIGASIVGGGPTPKLKPSRSWQPRDTLHGSRTGRFLWTIRKLAATEDNNAKAYALGASVGYATDLCGNPYINSVVGAPYRTHWWRHRWISNYVDTWAWGFYGAGGPPNIFFRTVVPSIPYTNWPNVCDAKLHERISMGGLTQDAVLNSVRNSTPTPGVLPQPFVNFWKNAYQITYGPLPPGIDDAGIQSAFAMTWLILWLQTSGEAIPCVPIDQINYPDNCGARPPWVPEDGSITTGGSVPSVPPPASRDTHPSVPEVVSGIVLAILGAFAVLVGNVSAGVALIVEGVELVADGETDPDWDKLNCYVGWVLPYFYNLTNSFHELLKWGGLGFPYTVELMHDDIAFVNAGIITPADAALSTVRSQATSSTYPASQWVISPIPSKQSNWANSPSEPLEPPTAIAYPVNPTWPFHFIDGFQPSGPIAPGGPLGPPGQVNPVLTLPNSPPLVRDPVQFAQRQGALAAPSSIAALFGNAVDVSLDLIQKTKPEELLDWDLDGDAGIGFPTWVLPTAGSSRSAAVPEP